MLENSKLPEHFLSIVLPRLGGEVVSEEEIHLPYYYGHQFVTYGLIFNNEGNASGQFCGSTVDLSIDFNEVPIANGELKICNPSTEQAKLAERMQTEVWDTSQTYPAYLYSPLSPAATRLVAATNNEVLGFLLGFWGNSKCDSWVESQIMAVNPKARSQGIAEKLKRSQRDLTDETVKTIRWTVDPLQWPNARLNYNKLGAVAKSFMRDYYGFVNRLNLAGSSRFRVEWPISNISIEENKYFFRTHSANSPKIRLGSNYMGIEKEANKHDELLIQVPDDWTNLQTRDVAFSKKVRGKTDDVFELIFSLGFIVGMAVESDNEKYLLAKKLSI